LSRNGIKTLYVTGEESVKQVKLRCARLKIDSDSIFVVSKTSLEDCLADVEKLSPNILAVDSIQTMYTGMVESAPGSISQVREVAGRLMMMSKAKGVATFIVGHVTKDGSIAGPRALEHIVDTVIYFEGNKGHPYRILRAVKNRFGSTNEIGVFEMREEGLAEVKNPSEMFLSERPAGAPGSVVVPSLEGTRPILVEVQALVSPTNFANPRRTCMGIDPNRISLMVAILEKRAGMNILASDIFVNIVGGMWVEEPGADLGAACALASSFLDKPIDPGTVLVGEVGLAGEVRTVSQVETRIREAHKLGFKRCIVPKGGDKINYKLDGMEIVQVSFLKEALDMLF
jgi:DNA repair protein RadA/Sms